MTEIVTVYSHEIWPLVPVWMPELDSAFNRCDEVWYERLLQDLPVKLRDA